VSGEGQAVREKKGAVRMQVLQRITKLQADALDFAPAILRAQHQPPSPSMK